MILSHTALDGRTPQKIFYNKTTDSVEIAGFLVESSFDRIVWDADSQEIVAIDESVVYY